MKSEDGTNRIAQKIYDNKELSVLFDAAQDAEPEDLQALHGMLMTLKRKEKGNLYTYFGGDASG